MNKGFLMERTKNRLWEKKHCFKEQGTQKKHVTNFSCCVLRRRLGTGIGLSMGVQTSENDNASRIWPELAFLLRQCLVIPKKPHKIMREKINNYNQKIESGPTRGCARAETE